MSDFRADCASFYRELQDEICAALEKLDGRGRFREDRWERKDLSGEGGGGGRTRVIAEGDLFEKGGVNFSEVSGNMPAPMSAKLLGKEETSPFYATGISLVLHPRSPMVPTVHANFRYIELGGERWVGGGADLTPYYLFEEDAAHFHATFKAACDPHGIDIYPRFKKWCDEYFHLPHRGEARGIGGIFFDYLGKGEAERLPFYRDFQKDAGKAFLPAYLPVAERRRNEPYGDAERRFHLIRRGRYAEFNLIYDRGTQFGLQTGGRTESILMSLPPLAAWEYDPVFEKGTREAKLLECLAAPREWV